MMNAFTIDLEDWAQSVIDPSLPISERVVENTERVLAWLDRHQVRATFFALGKVCERFPHLLPTIASAGHEIGSHGYGHELVYRLTPEQFRADIARSVEIITAQTGAPPLGYRAPAFSVVKASLWAGPILAEAGLRYCSSIFPIRHRRYGIEDAPRAPYRWNGCDLIEFPITTLRVLGRNWPCIGGGYTRLLPAAVMRQAIVRCNRAGIPAMVYMHPYEFAPGEVEWFRARGVSVRARRRWTQELWRGRVEPRLSRLVDAFEFGPMHRVLGLEVPLRIEIVPADAEACVAPL